jgi:hypothetical protein
MNMDILSREHILINPNSVHRPEKPQCSTYYHGFWVYLDRVCLVDGMLAGLRWIYCYDGSTYSIAVYGPGQVYTDDPIVWDDTTAPTRPECRKLVCENYDKHGLLKPIDLTEYLKERENANNT